MARKKTIMTPARDKLDAVGIVAICERVANGETMRCIADSVGVGLGRLGEYVALPVHSEQYARGMEQRADRMAEEILQIADDGLNDTYLDDEGNPRTEHDVIARSKLRVDARKWLASKMFPKRYGDKVAVGGDAENPLMVITKIQREIIDPT